MAKTKDKKKLFENKRFLQIFSLVVAVISWFLVIFFVSPETNETIADVPVKVLLSDTAAERMGLQVIEGIDQTVSVRIHGNRREISSLTADDLALSVSVSSVTGPGEFELPIIGANVSAEEFTIEEIIPSTISVKFDKLVSKTFEIELDAENVKLADGFFMEEEVVTPIEVTVTGPQEEVEQIAGCRVKVSLYEKLNQTLIAKDKRIEMLDVNGEVIQPENVTMDNETATVTMPVLQVLELPVKLSFINMPEYLSENSLRYTISNTSILIAGPPALVNSYSQISVGYVDVKNLTPTSSYLFDVNLPTGFINMENIQSIAVKFEMNDYISKTFDVSDIRVINQPMNYNISVTTKLLDSVTVYGPASVLETMTASDLVAEVDVSGQTIAAGQYRYPVSIYAPAKDKVWVSGEYNVMVVVEDVKAEE